MATVTVDCPFCHTNNDPAVTGGYCDSCGRRLPVSSAYVHTTKKARRLVADEAGPSGVLTARKQTTEALFTAAVLRLVLVGGFFVVGPVCFAKIPDSFLPVVMGCTVAGAAFLALLAVVARRLPFPSAVAAVVGLVAAWAVALTVFPAAWPLALVDIILLLWLARTVAISRDDRL